MGRRRHARAFVCTTSAYLAYLTTQAVYRFFLSLRTLLRENAAGTAAMITLPGYLLRALNNGAAHLRRVEWLCDGVLELESFAGPSATIHGAACLTRPWQAHHHCKPCSRRILVSYIYIVSQLPIRFCPLLQSFPSFVDWHLDQIPQVLEPAAWTTILGSS